VCVIDRYLGDNRFSYGLLLTFSLRVGEEGARASVQDLIIEGDGLRIAAPIYAQSNQPPRTLSQEYKFRLNEHPTYQWTPRLSSVEFVRLLSNITAIKIRGTYNVQGLFVRLQIL
jgi:laminin gamma 1